MISAPLSLHAGLWPHSRIAALTGASQRFRYWEIALLLLCGISAVLAVELLPSPIKKMPGQAILRSMLPLALGMAAVPRYGSGCVMSMSSLLTIGCLRLGTSELGVGAMTSACLVGVLLDAALLYAKRGWQLYGGFVLAGLTGNLAAMAARGGKKFIGLDDLLDRPWDQWLSQATVTYPLFGIVAGLVSSILLFSLRERSISSSAKPVPPS
jgi:hypothetical protein